MTKIRIILIMAAVCTLGALNAQTLKDGMYEYDRENYQSAISILSKVTTIEPAKAENFYYLGQSLLAADKTDSALIVFNSGVAAAPKDPYCYIGVGKCYLNQNKTADAMAAFDKAKEHAARKDARVYCAIAEAYTHSTNPNYAEALNAVAKADEMNNKDLNNYVTKGDIYFAKNEGGSAITSYSYAIDGKVSATHALTYTGVIWKQALKYDSALNQFQKAIAMDPNFAPAYREMAECYYRQNKLENAKNAFQKYLQLADKNDATTYRYAQFLFLSKDYKNCIKTTTELLSRSNNPYMYRLLAYSYLETGDSLNAKKYIDLTIAKMDPKNILALDYDYAARIQQKLGNDSLMLMAYGQEIKLDSSKASDIYTNLAKTFYDQKKYIKAAQAYLTKAKFAKTQDATDFFRAGVSFFQSKMYINADSAFSKAARLSPKWVSPNTYIGRSRNAQDTGGFTGIAVEAYKKVIEISGGDSVKYKRDLVEAWKYMAYYHCYVKHDAKEAGAALKHVLNIDAENKEALELNKNLVCVEQKVVPVTPVKPGEKKTTTPAVGTPVKQPAGK